MAEESDRRLITPLIFNDEPVGQGETAYFQFEPYADTFARIIAGKNTRTPLTIGVHGEWGSGKTTLMHRIQAKLDETKDYETEPVSFVAVDDQGPAFTKKFRPCKTVWFNAWKYGREEALLVALIEEVLRQMRREGVMQALYGAGRPQAGQAQGQRGGHQHPDAGLYGRQAGHRPDRLPDRVPLPGQPGLPGRVPGSF
jgi:hypothetical protein